TERHGRLRRWTIARETHSGGRASRRCSTYFHLIGLRGSIPPHLRPPGPCFPYTSRPVGNMQHLDGAGSGRRFPNDRKSTSKITGPVHSRPIGLLISPQSYTFVMPLPNRY